ncbi:MAG: PDZ domain-containing protein, partial [Pseudomonadota bacterium]
LFDLEGRVVGVNSQIYSRSGGFMGLSFAIPIEVAMDVAEQLRDNGRVSRGWLGVVIQEVTRELAESFGMARARGALVSQIVRGSPASRSDIEVGDVIVEFNGDPVPTSSSLPPLVGLVRAGTDAEVVVLRRGERTVLSVTIGELPGQEELANATGRGVEPKPTATRLGAVVAEPDETQREAAGVPEGGVIVTEVKDGGLADQAGIQPGDMVLMLGSDKVDSESDFDRLVEALPTGSSVAVLVHRGANPLFLPLRLPE